MKKLLFKMFFVSDCARGAAFALTLFLVGNWLWCGVWHLLWLYRGKLAKSEEWRAGLIGGFLLIALYAAAQLTVSLVGLVKTLRRERTFRALWYLLPAAVCIGVGLLGALRFFPPLFVLDVLITDKYGPPLPPDYVSRGLSFIPLSSWAAVFGVSLISILLGCFFFVRLFAAAERKRLKPAFGAAALTLWGLAALWQLLALGAAAWETRQTELLRQAVERRFGRSVDAAGVAAWYREQGKTDAEFWSRNLNRCETLTDPVLNLDGYKLSLSNRDLLSHPGRFADGDRYCRKHHAAIAKIESPFDTVPPLPELSFAPGEISGLELPYPYSCRMFANMEYNRLLISLWSRDVDTALLCWRRLGNTAEFLRRMPFGICTMQWRYVEHRYLSGMERLLESRRLPDELLTAFEAELAALEAGIPRIHEQAMYLETVFCMDTFHGLENGFRVDWTDAKCYGVGAFRPFRWIFPLLWYHISLDKNTILKNYQTVDFAVLKTPVWNANGALRFSNFLSVCSSYTANFYILLARVRGMRVLLRAERHRRRHGAFPARLDDLPRDPFFGKPLVYEVGPAEVASQILSLSSDGTVETDRRSGEAAQVYGDYPDDNGNLFHVNRKLGINPSRAIIFADLDNGLGSK